MSQLSSIARRLSSPRTVAQTLDFKMASGARILSVSVFQDHIDLAVASHPAHHKLAARELPPIPLFKKQRALSGETVKTFASVVEEWQVCAFVVAWPVQREGRCGAPCGRVLHTVEQLMQGSVTKPKNLLVRKSHSSGCTGRRPLCLWDNEHHLPPEDEWGRAPLYSNVPPTDKTLHVASVEQYRDHGNAFAVNVWDDFCCSHWPELYGQLRKEEEKKEQATLTALTDLSVSALHLSPKPASAPTAHMMVDPTQWNEDDDATLRWAVV